MSGRGGPAGARSGAAGARSGPVTRTALIRGARDLEANTNGPEIKKCKVIMTAVMCGQKVASHGLAPSPGVILRILGYTQIGVWLTQFVLSQIGIIANRDLDCVPTKSNKDRHAAKYCDYIAS